MTGLALAEPYFERINCHLLNKRPGEAMADLHAVGDLFRGQKSKDYYALKLRVRKRTAQFYFLISCFSTACFRTKPFCSQTTMKAPHTLSTKQKDRPCTTTDR